MNPKRLTAGELEECFAAMREEWSGRTADALLEHIAALTALPEDVERDREMVAKVIVLPGSHMDALSRLATAAEARVKELEGLLRESQAWMGKAVKALEPAPTPALGLREAVGKAAEAARACLLNALDLGFTEARSHVIAGHINAMESAVRAAYDATPPSADLAAVVEEYAQECEAKAQDSDRVVAPPDARPYRVGSDSLSLAYRSRAEGAREVLRRATGGQVPEVVLKTRVVEVLVRRCEMALAEESEALGRDAREWERYHHGRRVSAQEIARDLSLTLPTGPGGGGKTVEGVVEQGGTPPSASDPSHATEQHAAPVESLTARRVQKEAPEQVSTFAPLVSFEERPGECKAEGCKDFTRGAETGRLSARLEAKPPEWSGTYHADNVVMLERCAAAYGYTVAVERSPDPTWVHATFTPMPEKPRLAVVPSGAYEQPTPRVRRPEPTPDVPAMAQPEASHAPEQSCRNGCPDAPERHKFSCSLAQPETTAPEVEWQHENWLRVLTDGTVLMARGVDGQWREASHPGFRRLGQALAEARREFRHLGNICKRVEEALGPGAGAAWDRIATLKDAAQRREAFIRNAAERKHHSERHAEEVATCPWANCVDAREALK